MPERFPSTIQRNKHRLGVVDAGESDQSELSRKQIEKQGKASSVGRVRLAKSRRLQEDMVFGGVDTNAQGRMLADGELLADVF